MGPFIKVLTSLIRLRSPHTSLISLRCLSGDGATDIVSQQQLQQLEPSIINNINTSSNNIVLPGHVYFVATPIGNLLDISERAKRTLSDSDFICAEDTRHTRQLLNLLKIKPRKMLSHHEHNYLEQIPKIIDLAKSGQSIAIVSDAGTPGNQL